MKPALLPKHLFCPRPQKPDFLLTMTASSLCNTSGNVCNSTWESSSSEAEQSGAHRSRIQSLSHTSFNFICFSRLACCYFPRYTKANERGRGEMRLLTAARLTLHKIIHHDASPAAEQSHENSHLLQFS